MSAIVVDTDVFSYLLKRDPRAKLFLSHLDGRDLILSFMTVAELDSWVIQRRWGEVRIAQLESAIRNCIVYPSSRVLCRKWAQVSSDCRAKGKTIHCADAWIAATALTADAPLATNNAGDYSGVDGLTIISASEQL